MRPRPPPETENVMNIDPAVVIEKCAGCGIPIAPILLPVSIRLDIAEDPEGSPMGAFELIAVCPQCKTGSVYKGSECRFQPPQTSGAGRSLVQRFAHSAIRLTRRCGVDNCRVPITIHTTVGPGTTIGQILQETSAWKFDATCRGTCMTHFLRDAPSGTAYILEGIGIPPGGAFQIP